MENNPINPGNPGSSMHKGSGLLPPPVPPSKKGGTVKTLQAVTVILVVALVAAIVYIYSIMQQSKEDLSIAAQEKQEVINDLTQLKGDYEVLKTGNDTLNAQLTTERKKIDALMDKIKKTEASNRAKIRQFEKEIGNLKSLLTGYVRQIDSLSVENKALKAKTTKQDSEITKLKQQQEQLSKDKSALTSMVEKGGELKTRDIAAIALTSREKTTNRARQAEQFKVCLTLIENSIAKRGSRTIYIRIKSPDGSLLTQSVTNVFTPSGGGPQMIYSATREVEYAGEDLEVCVFYKDKDFLSGTFNIEVYLDGMYVGAAPLILK
ncbi:MAG: hypothetical protein LBD59_08775 [Prevotellaceae bacterium]|jgi:hypothetical protein|nr:hypothetical protein [Prevotellaceae bacterium]